MTTTESTGAVRGGTDDDIIFELRDVSVSFDMERGESKVLDDVDLDIRRNEILGVVGESGSGKSMFAESLLDAVVRPGQLTGEITYYPEPGRPVNLLDLSDEELRQARWEEISLVFQGALDSFNPTISIRTHFKETLRAHNADVDAGVERARELISDLYMDPERVLDSYPHELSGGMKQRALVALSLVLEPEVLVMDEPTAALDLLMQRSILSLLQDLQDKYDLTMVFITHDLPLVSELCDRLAVMYAFEFAEIGPTEDILTDAAHPYTRLLLQTTPNLDLEPDEMRPIKGSSPDPISLPSGCRFHPRCPLADQQCREEDPDRDEFKPDREVACFHWEQAGQAVALSQEDSQGGDD
jgi:oligopeptide/dipeptide ABC transporter ATP-binding protein